MNKGREQQKMIFTIINELVKQKRLAIIFDSAHFEPTYPFGNGYIRPDTVVYGFLCYRDKNGNWRKLGNQRKKFPLIIESKNEKIGASEVNERLIVLNRLFEQFLFLVVAKDTYGSLWNTAYEHSYFVVLEGRKLADFIAEALEDLKIETVQKILQEAEA